MQGLPSSDFIDSINKHHPEVASAFGAEALYTEFSQSPPQFAPALFSQLIGKTLPSVGGNAERFTNAQNLAGFFKAGKPYAGIEDAHYKPLNLALLQEQQRQGNAPSAHWLMADASNLRGLNLALSGVDVTTGRNRDITREGKQHADQALLALTRIMQLAVADAVNAHNAIAPTQMAEAIVYRDGGDEFSALISGLSDAQMQQVQERIHQESQTLMEQAGLASIPHAKHPHSLAQAGVSMDCAFQPLTANAPVDSIDNALEETISAQKAAKKPRAGMELTPKLSATQIDHAAATFGRYLREHPTPAPKPQRSAPVPTQAPDNIPDHKHDAFLTKVRAMQTAPDRHTLYARDSIDSALSRQANRLLVTPQSQAHVAMFELQNLAGVNNALGHSGADELIGQLARKIEATLGEPANGSYQFYRPEGKGGRLFIIAENVDEGRFSNAIESALEATEQQAAQAPAPTPLNLLPNPRHPGQKGVYFVATHHPIPRPESFAAINPVSHQVTEQLYAQHEKNCTETYIRRAQQGTASEKPSSWESRIRSEREAPQLGRGQ